MRSHISYVCSLLVAFIWPQKRDQTWETINLVVLRESLGQFAAWRFIRKSRGACGGFSTISSYPLCEIGVRGPPFFHTSCHAPSQSQEDVLATTFWVGYMNLLKNPFGFRLVWMIWYHSRWRKNQEKVRCIKTPPACNMRLGWTLGCDARGVEKQYYFY